jgi:hypothetical protein
VTRREHHLVDSGVLTQPQRQGMLTPSGTEHEDT